MYGVAYMYMFAGASIGSREVNTPFISTAAPSVWNSATICSELRLSDII